MELYAGNEFGSSSENWNGLSIYWSGDEFKIGWKLMMRHKSNVTKRMSH